jgi:hypothetical protein
VELTAQQKPSVLVSIKYRNSDPILQVMLPNCNILYIAINPILMLWFQITTLRKTTQKSIFLPSGVKNSRVWPMKIPNAASKSNLNPSPHNTQPACGGSCSYQELNASHSVYSQFTLWSIYHCRLKKYP